MRVIRFESDDGEVYLGTEDGSVLDGDILGTLTPTGAKKYSKQPIPRVPSSCQAAPAGCSARGGTARRLTAGGGVHRAITKLLAPIIPTDIYCIGLNVTHPPSLPPTPQLTPH